MEIGMIFSDPSGDNFAVLEDGDYWILGDNPEDLAKRSKSHGYDGCRFIGMWEEIYGQQTAI